MKVSGIIFLLGLATAGTAGAAQIEVTSPQNRETLRGGSFAVLRWSSRHPPPAPAQEWEAFLSIDGGAHYAFRITPHLDLALRQVNWLVPNVDARDARILIRTGNEREEREFALPLSFAIRRAALSGTPPQAVIEGRGESARPGDDGVVQWAEGDRAGTRVKEVVSIIPPGRMESLRQISPRDSVPIDAPKRVETSVGPRPSILRSYPSERRDDRSVPPAAVGILLQSHRQNI